MTEHHPPVRRLPMLARIVRLLGVVVLICAGLGAPAVRAAGPGTLEVAVDLALRTDPPVPGSEVVIEATVRHVGGTEPISARFANPIPEGMALAARPTIAANPAGSADPLGLVLEENSVRWRGTIAPGGAFTARMVLRVQPCAGDDRTITNTATAQAEGADPVSAEKRFTVNCPERSIQQVALEQRVVFPERPEAPAGEADASTATAWEPPAGIAPGQPAAIRTTVRNNGAEPVALTLVFHRIEFHATPDTPPGDPSAEGDLQVERIRLAPGASQSFLRPITRLEHNAEGELVLDPTTIYIVSAVTYCLADDRPLCPAPAEHPNVSARDVLRIPLIRSDLGDAPDSTNHFGAPMPAYPGVPASFPTVFDASTGAVQGPLHRHPRPFHLGRRVSVEVEADGGADQDPTNNIEPNVPRANLDRFDDGIRPNTLAFEHCRPATFQVGVYIHPAFKAELLEKGVEKAFLNVWLDGNRDGDWADFAQCPAAEGQPPVAIEHIVIDRAVEIAALQPGMNVITVAAGRVPWPVELKDKPAWLRVSLTERESNKPLTAAGIEHGDGRGYADPFRTGETEDYLINRPEREAADVAVQVEGRISVERDAETGEPRPALIWVVEYRNHGDAPARETVLRLATATVNGLLRVISTPTLTNPVRDGEVLRFNIGTLAPGAGGRIVVMTAIPANADAALARATINAANDGNPSNNEDSATVRLGLHAPVIVTPGDGTTCSPEVTVSGRSAPGSTVKLYNQERTLLGTAEANDEGRWTLDLTLAAGRHTLVAVANVGARISPPSAPVNIIVDPTLLYDPLSMRFSGPASEQGEIYRFRPVDADGRTDDGGWKVRLRASTTYTLSVRICCEEEDVTVSLQIDGLEAIALTDPDGDKIYTGSFTTGDSAGEHPFALTITCGALSHTARGTMYWIDRGMITDARSGEPLAGAAVLLLEQVATGDQGSDEAGEGSTRLRPWPGAEFGQQNPQVTTTRGLYGFAPPPGRYVLEVRRPGYQPYRSDVIVVTDQPIAQDIALTPVASRSPDAVVTIDEAGFDVGTLRLRPGALVEWVNLDTVPHTIAVGQGGNANLRSGLQAVTELSTGLLMPGERFQMRISDSGVSSGVLTVSDGANSFNAAAIVVDANAPSPQDVPTTIYLPMLMR